MKYNKHANDYLQKSYNKYGFDAFEFKQILACEIKDLELYEQLIIDSYKSNQRDYGFNLRVVAKSNLGSTTKRNTNKPGDRYNRLILIEPRRSIKDRRYWLCRCDCGVEKEIAVQYVRTGHTKSCGCLNMEKRSKRLSQWNKDNIHIVLERMSKIQNLPANGGQDALSKLIGG